MEVHSLQSIIFEQMPKEKKEELLTNIFDSMSLDDKNNVMKKFNVIYCKEYILQCFDRDVIKNCLDKHRREYNKEIDNEMIDRAVKIIKFFYNNTNKYIFDNDNRINIRTMFDKKVHPMYKQNQLTDALIEGDLTITVSIRESMNCWSSGDWKFYNIVSDENLFRAFEECYGIIL